MSDVEKDEAASDPTTQEARLVDIVVEEVSLVDQAANKRQFLVIKRARSGMSEANVTKNGSDTSEAATLEAIERVGKAVAELADEIDEPGEVARLVAIAEQLGELVRSILEADEEEEEEDGEEEEQAKANEAAGAPPAPSPPAPPPVAAPPASPNAGAFAKIEEMLTALRTKAGPPTAPPAPAAPPPPAPAAPPPAPPAAADPLAKVLDAINSLSTDLKAHGQRLGRLEKGVGLPSSQQTNERTRREPDEVSWPLDLNAPVGRDSVDKRVSFHDD